LHINEGLIALCSQFYADEFAPLSTIFIMFRKNWKI